MGLLEHPLEAVAFRLYSLPVPEASAATGAAAAWTCLAAAVLAAAAGVWRLCLSPSPPPSAAVAAAANASGPDRSHVAEASPETSRRAPEPAAAAAATPKERYTAYYRDVGCCCCGESDDEEDDAEERGDGDVFLSDDDGSTDPFGWEWEVVRSLQPLSPAAETTGRCRRSPTTGLGSSVVQLWDQGAVRGLTPAAIPRRRARVVVGTVSAF